jgi:hypothetical protein
MNTSISAKEVLARAKLNNSNVLAIALLSLALLEEGMAGNTTISN